MEGRRGWRRVGQLEGCPSNTGLQGSLEHQTGPKTEDGRGVQGNMTGHGMTPGFWPLRMGERSHCDRGGLEEESWPGVRLLNASDMVRWVHGSPSGDTLFKARSMDKLGEATESELGSGNRRRLQQGNEGAMEGGGDKPGSLVEAASIVSNSAGEQGLQKRLQEGLGMEWRKKMRDPEMRAGNPRTYPERIRKCLGSGLLCPRPSNRDAAPTRRTPDRGGSKWRARGGGGKQVRTGSPDLGRFCPWEVQAPPSRGVTDRSSACHLGTWAWFPSLAGEKSRGRVVWGLERKAVSREELREKSSLENRVGHWIGGDMDPARVIWSMLRRSGPGAPLRTRSSGTRVWK
ncbi:hypothetical protein Cadr_000016681 [Camelus dromedarius]|uniref:Uncharacterized protein n=1 Tax=Camelus dromedarius TaxID=9838 RepID=A0A5N4DES7_CAMDR|nr:hypothetical protein Cadr_000016681 [Camelus dromedarius]